jgi:hypothetical protein
VAFCLGEPLFEYGERINMEWFSKRTSIAGIQLPNWMVVLGAIIVTRTVPPTLRAFARLSGYALVTANNKRQNFGILFFGGTLFALFFIYVVITLNAPPL